VATYGVRGGDVVFKVPPIPLHWAKLNSCFSPELEGWLPQSPLRQGGSTSDFAEYVAAGSGKKISNHTPLPFYLVQCC